MKTVKTHHRTGSRFSSIDRSITLQPGEKEGCGSNSLLKLQAVLIAGKTNPEIRSGNGYSRHTWRGVPDIVLPLRLSVAATAHTLHKRDRVKQSVLTNMGPVLKADAKNQGAVP